MNEKSWYNIACAWKLDSKGTMTLKAWLANQGTPIFVEAQAKGWKEKLIAPIYMFGKSGKMWVGSSQNGMTPANSLIDELMIWDKAMSFDEIKSAETKICGRQNLSANRGKIKKVAGKKISKGHLKGFEGWGNMIIPLPQLKALPLIDGKIKREEFGNLSQLGINFVLDDLKPAENKSSVGFARYGDMLYIVCKSEFDAQQKLNVRAIKHDAPVFQDDCVEVYLYGKKTKAFCQWVVNPKGVVYDSKNRKSKWNSTAKVAASIQDGVWIAEILIPVSSLKIGAFEDIKINVARNDKTVIPGVLSSMVPLKGKSFMQAERFAEFLPISSFSGVRISYNFIAGPAGQNGFNSTCVFPKCLSGARIDNVVIDAKKQDVLYQKSLSAKGYQTSFDHFLTTTKPVIEQIVISKGGLVLANMVNIFRTQAKVSTLAGEISKKKYPWLGNNLGKGHSVPGPFMPVTFEDKSVKVLIRKYDMKTSNVFSQFSVLNRYLLAGDIKLQTGRNEFLKLTPPELVKKYPDYVKLVRKVKKKNFTVGKLYIKIGFDGFIWCNLKLKNIKLNKLALVIPLNPELMFSLTSASIVDRARNQQIKFLKEGVNLDFRFIRSLWLGSEKGGLAVFLENDKEWKNDNLRKAIQLECGKKAYALKMNFINIPSRISNSSFAWGMLVTPTRKMKRSVDRDMAWIDIHFPEVMQKELNDYPGQEKDFVKWLAAQGVKQVVLFDYWARYQGSHVATYPKIVKDVVKRCHKEGMKVLLYRSRELSTADPHWKDFSKAVLCTPTSYGYRRTKPVKQVSYTYCPASQMQDYFVWSCDWLMREYDVDGFYLDSPAHAQACFNSEHGCGYLSKAKSSRVTYPIRATREMIKRLYRVVRKYKPDGLLDSHGDFSPAEGLLTSRFYGEQYYKMRHYDDAPARILPANVFRSLFCSGTGPSMNMLMYSGCPFNVDEAVSLSFINGVSMRPHSLQSSTGKNCLLKVSRVWDALRKFDTDHSEWIPYWSKDFNLYYQTMPKVFGDKEKVKVSYYKKGNSYLYLIASTAVHVCKITIANPALKKHKIKAVNMLTGKALSTKDASMWTLVEPYRLLMIKVESRD